MIRRVGVEVLKNKHRQAKGTGKQKKTRVGYKAQIAESLPEKDALNQNRVITSIVTQRANESDEPGLVAVLIGALPR